MSLADIIQIIIGVLSLVATIAVSFLIYWLQSRHEKEIQKLQCEKERIALQEKARLFLIDNQEERDYLPWCIIAANLHPLEKHTRKIYSEYCRCSEELQNEILNQAGYKIKQFTGKYWLQGCIDKLQQDIEKYNLGRDYLYDGAKYFHRSYDRYRELEWNGTPNIFEPINKENRLMMILNVAQISIGEYIDEYFYYFVDKKMDFDKETPIPPIDYVWEYQSLAHTREETVCMWMMELVENIATIINDNLAATIQTIFLSCKQSDTFKTYLPLNELVKTVNFRNKDNVYGIDDLMGVSLTKEFIKSPANTISLDVSNYKIVKPFQFACNLMHVGRDKKVAVGMLTDADNVIISPAFTVFETINNNVILPEVLVSWFSQSFFDNEVSYLASEGIRDGIKWDTFAQIPIFIPEFEIQTKIQNIYKNIQQNKLEISTLNNFADTFITTLSSC